MEHVKNYKEECIAWSRLELEETSVISPRSMRKQRKMFSTRNNMYRYSRGGPMDHPEATTVELQENESLLSIAKSYVSLIAHRARAQDVIIKAKSRL